MREVARTARSGGDPGAAPQVSVIVIFLNAQRFIEEAVESVLAQTHEDWELLLVDDGSTDGSNAVALRYQAGGHGRVRYLHHPGHANLGMSASRNLGLRSARGQYVALLDADDVWRPHKLARQVAILTAEPRAAMVYGAPEYWYSWTGRVEDSVRDTVRDIGIGTSTLMEPPALLTLFLQGRAVTPCPSDILVRRSDALRVGGFEDSFRGLYEDQVFCAKVCLDAPVFVSTECWDRYRQHPESCSSTARSTSHHAVARLAYLKWLEKFLTSKRIEVPELWQALRDRQSRYRASSPDGLVGRLWRSGQAALKRSLGV
jgi:glycosyltransferase involved in cell wall biosynthesis